MENVRNGEERTQIISGASSGELHSVLVLPSQKQLSTTTGGEGTLMKMTMAKFQIKEMENVKNTYFGKKTNIKNNECC